ncbi:MAG: membrane protein insertion efficiency factor YidD [Cyanosarcina radialis HA8281-LM2]|nr:membrane protein insertion efficiency factor YidD [Cyanosarcina radialis HA8281-LM2]
MLYGGQSCSQYVKGAIAKKGLLGAIAASVQRFAACKRANQILRTRYSRMSAENGESNPQGQENTNSNGNTIADSCSCCACGSADCAHCASALDCSAIDCGGADACSGLDCSGLDCSGCSW